jgi:hypothetical protein
MPRVLPENKGKPWNPDRSDFDPDRVIPPKGGKRGAKNGGKAKLATVGNDKKSTAKEAAARDKRLAKVKV